MILHTPNFNIHKYDIRVRIIQCFCDDSRRQSANINNRNISLNIRKIRSVVGTSNFEWFLLIFFNFTWKGDQKSLKIFFFKYPTLQKIKKFKKKITFFEYN